MNANETAIAVAEPQPPAPEDKPILTPPPPEVPVTNGAPPEGESGKLYFKKLLANMPFKVGKDAVPFELLERNIGVLAIVPEEKPEIAAALKDAADRRKGGIVLIDEPTYLELKKNFPAATSGPSSGRFARQGRQQSQIRVWRPPTFGKKAKQQQAEASPLSPRQKAVAVAHAAGDRLKFPSPTKVTLSKTVPDAVGVTGPVSGGGPVEGSGVLPSTAAPPATTAQPATARRGPRLRPQRTAAAPSNL